MNKPIPLGTLLGLKLSAQPNAFAALFALWMVATAIIYFGLGQSSLTAIVGGFFVAGLHIESEFWHHYGHAWAARRVGYPMIGVEFWLILGRSIYPADEPALPGRIHIRRAFGGPMFSFITACITSVVAVLFMPLGGPVWGLLVFLALDNLLFFTLGALLPLDFVDGGTILKWWGK
jgi:hypothetical protein